MAFNMLCLREPGVLSGDILFCQWPSIGHYWGGDKNNLAINGTSRAFLGARLV